ncbi:MAG: hypothetical protein IRY90_14225, partial [Actinomadura rubrobrunea]|nr:hypothetical protein [Actinomadura rubrobrunea]
SVKVAAIAAFAVGAVAVGGVAWAAVAQPSAQPNAGLRSGHSAVADGTERAKGAVPSAVPTPTCVPVRTPKAPDAPKAPALPKTPGVQVPGVQVPGVKAPDVKDPHVKAPEVKVPAVPNPADAKAVVEGTLAKVTPPTTLPDCGPAAPKAPGVPAPSSTKAASKGAACTGLKPAVPVGGAVERAVMLPKGLKHVASTTDAKKLGASTICTLTQKWVGRAGQWISVERIQSETAMTQSTLRRTLGLPGDARKVDLGSAVGWQSPAGGGVLVVDPAGQSALLVNGSPVFAASLKDIAGELAGDIAGGKIGEKVGEKVGAGAGELAGKVRRNQ